MNRNNIISTLTNADSNHKDIRAALKAAGEYKGWSRKPVSEMRAHGLAVAIVMQDEDNAKRRATRKPPTKSAPRKQDGKRLAASTIRKMKALLASGTPDAEGVMVFTADDFVSHGLGRTWVSDYRNGRITAMEAEGYTAAPTRGTLVVMPLAKDSDVEVAS